MGQAVNRTISDEFAARDAADLGRLLCCMFLFLPRWCYVLAVCTSVTCVVSSGFARCGGTDFSFTPLRQKFSPDKSSNPIFVFLGDNFLEALFFESPVQEGCVHSMWSLKCSAGLGTGSWHNSNPISSDSCQTLGGDTCLCGNV